MLDHRHHLTRLRLRMGVHGLDVKHGARRHALGRQRFQPMLRGPRLEQRRQGADQGIKMIHATLAHGKARIVRERLRSKHLAQPLPVGLVGGADVDPAVGGLERLIGSVERVRRAERSRRNTRGERYGGLPVGVDDTGFEQ